jgi:hypothetical protein
MTPEEKKRAIEYWQYRKAKARKKIKDVALIGCPIFMTCSEEINKAMMEKKKETLKEWTNELRFVESNIKKIKEMI